MEIFALVGFIFGMAGFSFGIVGFTTALSSIRNVKELEIRMVALEGKSITMPQVNEAD